MVNRHVLRTCLACLTVVWAACPAPGENKDRLLNPGDVLVLYDFAEGDGAVVHDVSGSDQPLNLKITDPGAVRWTEGGLKVLKATSIQSARPASRIAQAVGTSGELTVEAWITPAQTGQKGPARIVTISASPNERNLTLGQDSDRYDVRLRTSNTSSNGIPSVSFPAGTVTTKRSHVVYARDRSGTARIYVDGRQVGSRPVTGRLSQWDGRMRIGLANEFGGDRSWLGTFHQIALYSRSFSPAEVEKRFRAGPGRNAAAEILAERRKAAAVEHFHTRVAAVLSRHCLECHDAASRQGGLDLSTRQTALKGGENGSAFIAGRPDESLLWQYVESGEMPKDRAPLSDADRDVLKQWIADGALWPDGVIDPALYAHSSQSSDVWVQRLTRQEYISTIQSAIGVDISAEAAELLPADLRADGFSNTAYNLNVDLQHVTAYARLAEIAVERLDVPAFARRFSSNRSVEDNPMRELVAAMGKWLLRGPLNDEEIALYRGIATTVAAAGGGYDESVALIIEAMLQSPRFVYRIENQRGDGTVWPVTDYELASRLSYILWGSSPDEPLFRAADAGELLQPNVLRTHVDRMLKDRRAVDRSKQFIDEWLNLRRLSSLSPSPDRFPKWNSRLARDMRHETLAYFEEIAWRQKRPLTDLLNAQITFATPALAAHYRLPESAIISPANSREAIAKYDVSSIPGRGGLLTHGSVLSVGGDDASMVSRGLFVLHELLRGAVNDPPPGVNTVPPPTRAGVTQRRIAETRIANQQCGGCHSRFEPLAFGLEKFDGVGVWRDRDEHGNLLRDDGEILFPGSAKPVSFQSSTELMDLLAGSERVRETFTWKIAQFAVGRPLSAQDVPVIRQIHEEAWKNDGTYASIIAAVVTSDLVLKTRTEPRQRTAAAIH